MLFTAVLAVAAGLLIGAFPAFQLAGGLPMAALRDGTRVVGRTGPLRAGLVSSQLALALMLLAGAGLLARSFVALLDVPPGFAADRLLTFTASLPAATYRTGSERAAFFERAAGELERLPGVDAVTMTTTLPVAGRGNGAWFNRIDRPWPADQTPPGVPNRVVRANYFETMGIPVLRGRTFTAHDGLDGQRAVVVSESVARRFYPGEDPIGRHVFMGAPDNRVVPDSEIVGIVADVKQRGLDEERPEAVYAPHARCRASAASPMRRGPRPTRPASAPAVRDVMRRLDPGVPLDPPADHGRDPRPGAGADAVVDAAGGGLRGRRVDAGRDRCLRRAVVHGGPADAGIRHPDGARGDARRGCCGWWCSAACCRWASASGSAWPARWRSRGSFAGCSSA